MQNYKDKNKGVHNPEMSEAEGLAFLEKRRPDLMPFVAITQAQADALSAPIPETPAQANARKDGQVELELGTPMVRLLLDVLVPMIDGAANPAAILVQLKAARRLEL